MSFQDHFSAGAGEYARFRPTYPAALFEFLAALAPSRGLAWDCGTGSGQAAIELAEHFHQVVATDASADQLALAPPHPRVDYRCESAEAVSLPNGSVDLLTVAAAVHWFSLKHFYAEALRVLRPEGIIAVWAYHLPVVTPAIDAVIVHFSSQILRADWPSGSNHVLDRYTSLPFPFAGIDAPAFAIDLEWSVEELIGFLGSWSAANAYRTRTGTDPVELVRDSLVRAFGHAQKLHIRCPIFLRVGRNGRFGGGQAAAFYNGATEAT